MAYPTDGMDVYWEYYDGKFFSTREKNETIMIDFSNKESVRLYNPNTSQYNLLTDSEFKDYSVKQLNKSPLPSRIYVY